jgi:GNAT superfamily N-acetyltransferase
MKISTLTVHESYQKSGLGKALAKMAVKKQDEEGKKMWVSAMPASQPVLRYVGFNIETKLIEGPVEYLHGFGAREPQRRTTSVQLGDKD